MDSYERLALRRYVANILVPRGRSAKPSHALVHWLGTHARLLGIGPRFEIDLSEVFDESEPVDREMRKTLRPILDNLRRPEPEVAPSPLQCRLAWLAEVLKLDRRDAEIIGAAVRFVISAPFSKLVEAAGCDSSCDTMMDARIIGRALNKPDAAIFARFDQCMPLRVMGLIEQNGRRDNWITLSRTALRVARMNRFRPEQVDTLLFGQRKDAALEWGDFDHLGAPRELAERLIAAALGKRTKGVNLLLHGSPGTGKTEFARTLARKLAARVVFVGETDNDDGEPNRGERVSAFMLARAVAGRTGRTILVVDEADDMFLGVDDDGAAGRRGSKVFMNRLVETTEAPVIWITNAPARLGPAVVRRMDLAIAFPEPGRLLRSRIVDRVLTRRGLKLSKHETERIAGLDAPPAVIDRAVRVARLVKGKAADAELAAGSIVTLLKGRGAAPPPTSPLPFDPALSSADTDLTALAEQVAAASRKTGRMDVSFCLYGLPGTGKSAYARHLAARIGLDVLEKRASDLIGPYVGQTEAQIADTFREAEAKRAMLVLDEADSFLRDRAGAFRSWEVTQVNEMLTWMERHSWPFVCTTNLMDSLDPATLRRFVFKVRFLPMTPAQAASAYRLAFGQEPPAGVAALDPLTPGDFAVVARKAAVLGEHDGARLLHLLRAEVEAKPGAARRPIGFARD